MTLPVARCRPAAAGDVDAVADLEERFFGAEAWSPAAVREELAGPGRQARVAVDALGRVIGYVVLRAVGDTVDLHRIGVAPGHRRRGIAGRLLDGCDVSSCARMLLEVRADNTAALSFYRRRGFGEIARRAGYYADGTDAVVLERLLTGPAAR